MRLASTLALQYKHNVLGVNQSGLAFPGPERRVQEGGCLPHSPHPVRDSHLLGTCSVPGSADELTAVPPFPSPRPGEERAPVSMSRTTRELSLCPQVSAGVASHCTQQVLHKGLLGGCSVWLLELSGQPPAPGCRPILSDATISSRVLWILRKSLFPLKGVKGGRSCVCSGWRGTRGWGRVPLLPALPHPVLPGNMVGGVPPGRW